MFLNKTQWTASDGEHEYSAEVNGIKITLNKWKKNSRASFGSREVLARHFTGKERWQIHAREIYGEKALKQINKVLVKNQKKFDAKSGNK